MRINKNIFSLGLYNNYKKNINKNSVALERISSGMKVNSAKDNPIKLEKSENLKMQIRALQVAEKNLQDGISMIQTADTAMGKIDEALIRIKELMVQSGTDIYTDEDRDSVQQEINELVSFIDDLAKNTEFNGNKLLNNNIPNSVIKMQVGASVGDVIEVPNLNLTIDKLGIDNISVLNSNEIDINIEKIDKAIVKVNSSRGAYGAIQGRIETSTEIVGDGLLILEDSNSNIVDADVAFEMTEFAKSSILIESATAMIAQSNKLPKDVLNILSNLIK